MNYSWSESPEERFLIELSRRPDLGIELRGLRLWRGGGPTASYKLVPEVREGDVVVHYDSQAEQRRLSHRRAVPRLRRCHGARRTPR